MPGKDLVAALAEQIQRHQVTLDYQKELGFLPGLLKHLDVNVDSQMLVFSKTSFHADLIGPATPRAVYFNDDVFIGVAQRGDIELAALDPTEGLVFYSLEGTPTREPRFLRRDAVCATVLRR